MLKRFFVHKVHFLPVQQYKLFKVYFYVKQFCKRKLSRTSRRGASETIYFYYNLFKQRNKFNLPNAFKFNWTSICVTGVFRTIRGWKMKNFFSEKVCCQASFIFFCFRKKLNCLKIQQSWEFRQQKELILWVFPRNDCVVMLLA